MKKPKTLVVNSVAILGLTGIIGGLGGLTAFAATPSTVSAGSPTSHIEHHGKHHPDQQWKELASILKISPKTLHADLKAKETIAEIAQKQGISTQTLTAELEAPAKTHLVKAVANGKMTIAREQAILAKMNTRISNMLTRTWR